MVISITEEYLYYPLFCSYWLLEHVFNFDKIHLNLQPIDNMPKQDGLINMEFGLG